MVSGRTTCGRGCVWWQAGNRTGHCSQCHRTFSGTSMFDAHQRLVDGDAVCLDPAVMVTQAGEPRFASYVDKTGATVWKSAREQPADLWGDDTD